MHADTLVAYVVHFGKVKGPLLSAKMESIDSGVRRRCVWSAARVLMQGQGMNLSYVRKDEKQTPGSVRVKFDPPLISYDEVRISVVCAAVTLIKSIARRSGHGSRL